MKEISISVWPGQILSLQVVFVRDVPICASVTRMYICCRKCKKIRFPTFIYSMLNCELNDRYFYLYFLFLCLFMYLYKIYILHYSSL